MQNHSLIGELILTTLLLSQLTVTAQQPNAQKGKARGDEEVIVSHYPTISIDVLVLSSKTGAIVDNLTHDDFTILENNTQKDIFTFRRSPAPLSLLVIVDTASTDDSSNKRDNQISALKSSLIGGLDSTDEVSIMALGERPALLQDYTNNKQLLNASLDKVFQHRLSSKLPVEDRLSGVLQEVAEHARHVQNPEFRRAVILISDSAENAGDIPVSPEAVKAMLGQLPIIFCWNQTRHFAPPVFSESQYSLDKISLPALVSLTGGEFVNNDWKTFIERMRGRYRIAYLPSGRRREGQVVRITVQLKASVKRDINDLVLIYPRAAVITASR